MAEVAEQQMTALEAHKIILWVYQGAKIEEFIRMDGFVRSLEEQDDESSQQLKDLIIRFGSLVKYISKTKDEGKR